MLVRMDLARVIIVETSDSQIIILRERDGNRQFPILIGTHEALAIDRRVKGIESPRPLTHDLIGRIVESMGGELESIMINDLQDHTFYAKLVVRRDGDRIEIDARPSDAIALGVSNSTPIYVEEDVLRAVCSPEESDPKD